MSAYARDTAYTSKNPPYLKGCITGMCAGAVLLTPPPDANTFPPPTFRFFMAMDQPPKILGLFPPDPPPPLPDMLVY